MRKLLILLFIFNCIGSAVPAQNATADSLNQLLATAKEDTSRVLFMYQLGRFFANSKPDTALTIAGQALELSRNIGFKKGQVMNLIVTGNVFMNKGNYPRSLEILLQALKIAEETEDDLKHWTDPGSSCRCVLLPGGYKKESRLFPPDAIDSSKA